MYSQEFSLLQRFAKREYDRTGKGRLNMIHFDMLPQRPHSGKDKKRRVQVRTYHFN